MSRLFVLSLLSFTCLFTSAQGYWQQEVNYKIRVALDDEAHELHAFEEIEYINNSPYALEFIYMHLWPNAYKNNHTAFARQKVRDGSNEFYFANDEDRGSIESLDFEVDGETVAWIPNDEYIDVAKILLNTPLKSGGKVIIKTPFKVKIPKTFSRLGHVKQSYQISQWYPKPAVFDKEGWHPMPYLDQGEFYSEYGSFEVDITVPENYVVASTGVLQNDAERKWLLDRIDKYINEGTYIVSSTETKTLTYKQDKIHDFAWFADKNYNVIKGEVILPNSKKKVDTWYMYTSRFESSKEKALKDLRDATYYYSKYVGEYPYSSVTAVTGALGAGGGMEYPMITVTDPSAIIHEVGHNWFYGILGSDERSFGWMDEGLNSFFEEKTYEQQRLMDTIERRSIEEMSGIQRIFTNSQKYTSEALETRNLNQPVHYTSNGYHSANYFVQLYQKPVLLMRYLQDYLGEELFIACFHEYYDKWRFKHPHIKDMQYVFESVSGKDLAWLFQAIIEKNVSPMVKIKNIEKNKRGFDAHFISMTNTPIKVNLLNKNKEVESERWVEFKHGKTSIYYNTEGSGLSINDNNMVFRSRAGHYIRKDGILRKMKMPQLSIGFARDKVNRAGVGIIPSVGINSYDGFLTGLVFSNNSIRSKKINYTLMPMYGVKSEKLKGIGSLNYYYYPNRDFETLEIAAVTQHFANYRKYGLNVGYWSKVEMFDISWNTKIKFKSTFVETNVTSEVYQENILNTLEYKLYHKDAVREFKFYPTVGIYSDDNNNKTFTSSVELYGSLNFTENDIVSLRIFAGAMSKLDDQSYYYFGLSNGMDYTKDAYAYDRVGNNTHMNHSNGLDGGFRAFDATIGKSLITSNVTVDLPYIPFSIYGDVGVIKKELKWGSGLGVKVVNDLLEVHFPLIGSNFQSNSPSGGIDFFNNIRVMLKLPLKSVNEIAWDKI